MQKNSLDGTEHWELGYNGVDFREQQVPILRTQEIRYHGTIP